MGKKKLKEIKDKVKVNITQSIREMQVSRNLENWVEEMVISRFDELIASMEEETERLLQDSEHSMNEIRKDLAQNEAERANTLQRLNKAEERCIEIVRDLEPVCKKVESALKEAV